ncbi:MAG: rod-binding protein [Pseudomonadota bacterium]|nr:rod-binding protein [Pseudomonadota bacterium]MEC7238405.1 rod-binding protein [Pseudomonadota bacterium]
MKGDMNMAGIIQAARTTAENASMKPLDRNASLREAAEQFEAIFLNEFIKQARKAKLADDIFGSEAQDTYQDMMDRELSTQLAGRVNLGIAEALVRQLGQGKSD